MTLPHIAMNIHPLAQITWLNLPHSEAHHLLESGISRITNAPKDATIASTTTPLQPH